MVRIEIETDKMAADGSGEVAQVLADVGLAISMFHEQTGMKGTLRGTAGNVVGSWEIIDGRASRVI